MVKNYSLYSIYLNIISVIIGIICLIFSIMEHKFLIVTIILISMTLIELFINIINYRKLKSKVIDKNNKI